MNLLKNSRQDFPVGCSFAALNRAGAQVKDTHQTARNQSAGDAALAARNFHEVANARGLNTGTTGQAALARNVTLQNNLNTINTSEASTLADLELQRAQAEAEYNNAIAQAQAEGDYAMAAALYQESVRVQEQLLAQQAQAAQLAYQQQQDALATQQARQSQLASLALTFLQNGVPLSDSMLNALGISATDVQNWNTTLFKG